MVLIISTFTIVPLIVLLIEAMRMEHFDESILGSVVHGIKY